ncbi:hypothetical protein PPIV_ORF69 [Pike-perch iridovirus]|uniref:Uncharacterized protein n=1 Tax=Pike-perch iridovirus TaxID=575979 RepID=A0A1B2ITW1_9VIRU|nr:hypothetical protein PPIV_ORF69 [Pike-perch iridovirus]
MIRALCTIVLIAAGVAVALYLSLVYGYYESVGVPDASWLTALTGDRPDAKVPFFDKAVGEAPEDKAAYTERPYPVSSTQSPTTTTTLKPTTMAVLASIGATPTPVVCHNVRGDMQGIGCNKLAAMGFTVLHRETLPQGGYHTVVMKKTVAAAPKGQPEAEKDNVNARYGMWHPFSRRRSPFGVSPIQ